VDYSEISAAIWNIPEEGRNEKKKVFSAVLFAAILSAFP
jgi:hypothetical protein